MQGQWLLGRRTGRLVTLLSFAGPGATLDAGLADGDTEAELALHPGPLPSRGVVRDRGDAVGTARLKMPVGGRLARAGRELTSSAAVGPSAAGDWQCLVSAADRPVHKDHVMDEVTFTVTGYPPAKNEAKSMLAPGHTHATRVSDLLRAARDAVAGGVWSSRPGDSLGLELVLTWPAPPPSDATNYLGGVGDVLEAKSRRGELAHLADLATVALYENDRQFHDVRYRWQTGAAVQYNVRLGAVAAATSSVGVRFCRCSRMSHVASGRDHAARQVSNTRQKACPG